MFDSVSFVWGAVPSNLDQHSLYVDKDEQEHLNKRKELNEDKGEIGINGARGNASKGTFSGLDKKHQTKYLQCEIELSREKPYIIRIEHKDVTKLDIEELGKIVRHELELNSTVWNAMEDMSLHDGLSGYLYVICLLQHYLFDYILSMKDSVKPPKPNPEWAKDMFACFLLRVGLGFEV